MYHVHPMPDTVRRDTRDARRVARVTYVVAHASRGVSVRVARKSQEAATRSRR